MARAFVGPGIAMPESPPFGTGRCWCSLPGPNPEGFVHDVSVNFNAFFKATR